MSTTAHARLLLLTLLGSSCAGPLASVTQSRRLAAVPLELKWAATDDQEQARVGSALERMAPGLGRWGGLGAPVTVLLAPSHDALVSAVHRDYDWLRAWAQWDTVIVQSPRTWGPTGVAQNELDELLLHELTHCLLFQRASRKEDFPRAHLPLWFREGMATVTANQGYRFPTLEDLAGWLHEHPALDPIADGEELSREHYRYVYATAHHAFTFVLRRAADEGVLRVLKALGEGQSFEEAFRAGAGLTVEALRREFLDYVRSGTFRTQASGSLR